MLKLGTVALDGTKVHANASRHSALSFGHANKIEAQLKEEVVQLLALAEQTDRADLPDELSIPAELERRHERLAAIAKAKVEIEARAAQRFAEEQAEYAATVNRREREANGEPPRGKPPTPPTPGPRENDQVNLTDADSRIMKTSQGFEQCYNAQAAVDTESMLVVAHAVTQAGNDKQQIEPMLTTLAALTDESQRIDCLLADTGYLSEHNVDCCAQAKIEPLIALKRERHHQPWQARFSEPSDALPPDATALQTMAHRLKTLDGRKTYALRKHTVEPVFGIIKSVMGFRQFMLRGIHQVQGEWNLVTLAWNMKRMFQLQGC